MIRTTLSCLIVSLTSLGISIYMEDPLCIIVSSIVVLIQSTVLYFLIKNDHILHNIYPDTNEIVYTPDNINDDVIDAGIINIYDDVHIDIYDGVSERMYDDVCHNKNIQESTESYNRSKQ